MSPQSWERRPLAGPRAQLAIMASGDGSNFEAIVRACGEGRLPARVAGLVCNRPGAGVIARAERLGVPFVVLDQRDFAARGAHEDAILSWLAGIAPDWLLLAGYLRVLSAGFVSAYRGRILNVHPADTRRHQGQGGYQWAVAQQLAETAVTVHFVDDGLDTGPIVMQAAIPVLPGDTAESLAARGLPIEHELYVRAIGKVLAEAGTRMLATADGGSR